MSSTIACFCGNIYTAPPDRCAVCGSTIEDAPLGPLEFLERVMGPGAPAWCRWEQRG